MIWERFNFLIFISSFLHNFYKRFHDFKREREREKEIYFSNARPRMPLVYHVPYSTTLISRFEFDISPKVDDRVSFPGEWKEPEDGEVRYRKNLT